MNSYDPSKSTRTKSYKIELGSGKRMTLITKDTTNLEDAWTIAKKMTFKDEIVDIKG